MVMTKQPHTDDITGIIAMLPEDKRKLFLNTLYSIARTAIDARCGELQIMDIEILQSLEAESNAIFEEWIFK